MRKLNEKELMKYSGGKSWIVIGGIAIITFIIGVIDGYVRPFKCHA